MPIALILELVKKFLPQIILVVSILVLYYVWHRHVYDQGYNLAKSECAARDAQIEADMAKVRRDEERKTFLTNEQTRKNFMGAVETYAKSYSDAVIRANDIESRSVRINAKTTKCSSSTLPGSAKNTAPDSGRSEEIQRVEISGQDARNIHEVTESLILGETAVNALLEYIEKAGMIEEPLK